MSIPTVVDVHCLHSWSIAMDKHNMMVTRSLSLSLALALTMGKHNMMVTRARVSEPKPEAEPEPEPEAEP